VSARIVYIVDDDTAVRDSLCALLDTYGFDISPHASGNEFLSFYSYDDTGCVLLDINMPGLSGIDVLDRLRLGKCKVPVIAITGRGDPGLKERLLLWGASAVFDKPIDEDDLLKAIEAAFTSSVSHHT
jgi:two-component system response regulator FixJ